MSCQVGECLANEVCSAQVAFLFLGIDGKSSGISPSFLWSFHPLYLASSMIWFRPGHCGEHRTGHWVPKPRVFSVLCTTREPSLKPFINKHGKAFLIRRQFWSCSSEGFTVLNFILKKSYHSTHNRHDQREPPNISAWSNGVWWRSLRCETKLGQVTLCLL